MFPFVRRSREFDIYQRREVVGVGVVLQEKLFLKVLENSQAKTCTGVSFRKGSFRHLVCKFIKKKLQHRCLPVNI